MNPKTDVCYKKLSANTLRKIDNCFKNCNSRDISEHIFDVINGARVIGEIENKDVFRLGFKFLNDYLNRSN